MSGATLQDGEQKSLLDVNKENTVTSALWMIPTVPYDVNKPQ